MSLPTYTPYRVTRPCGTPMLVISHGGSMDPTGSAHVTWGFDVLRCEHVELPVTDRWDAKRERSVIDAPPGWSVQRATIPDVEAAAGLPAGSLPRGADAWPDPWIDRQLLDPVFQGVQDALAKHTDLGFYFCDWRPWISGRATCPMEEDMLASGQVRYEGRGWGSGYADTDIARFASAVSRLAARDHLAPSAAALAYLREHYDDYVTRLANPRPYEREGPRKPKRSFDQMLRKAGFTARVLRDIDQFTDRRRAAQRKRADDAAQAAAGGQLALAV